MTVYYFGGINGSGNRDGKTLAYDPDTDSWDSSLTDMPTARNRCRAVEFSGSMYVLGGNSDSGYTGINERYDPDTDSWDTSVADLPTELMDPGVTTDGSYIWLIGGREGPQASDDPYWDGVLRYDPVADSWTDHTNFTSMPTGRRQLNSTYYNGMIYSIGGESSTTASETSVEGYDITSDSWNTTLSDMPTGRHAAASGLIGGSIYIAGGDTTNENVVNALEAYEISSDSWATKADMPTARDSIHGAVIGTELFVPGGRDGSGNEIATNEKYSG